MPNIDIHPMRSEIAARRKTVTNERAAVEEESLRGLIWLTAADVKILTLG